MLERCHASSLKIKIYNRSDNHFLKVPIPLLWPESEPMVTSSGENSDEVKENKSQF